MSEYWKEDFDRHVSDAGDDPFRQVGRTLNGQPMSAAMFERVASHTMGMLELATDHLALDLCCGNGLLSAEMAHRCRRVVGVDFSPALILTMARRAADNVWCIIGEASMIRFRPESFDRILFAAAIQEFEQAQVISLFGDIVSWLKPGGVLLVTDVPDAGRIWSFFDNDERRATYFTNTMNRTPVLGTWFDREWLEKLAEHAGFGEARALDQPEDLWYAHYRFDLLCRK